MKLSYGTNGYRKFPIQEVIKKVSNIKYEGIDLMADYPHAYPPHLNSVDRAALKGMLEEHNMKIANINASTVSALGSEILGDLRSKLPVILKDFWDMYEPTFMNPTKEYREMRINYIIQAIDLASDLGAPSVSTFTGIRLPNIPSYQAWNWLSESLERCIEHAKKKKIRLLIEPEPTHFVEYVDQLLELFKKPDCEWLGVNLDIGHSICSEGSVQNLCKKIKELEGKIYHVHIEDIKDRYHFHLLPGRGNIQRKGFEDILDALYNVKYNGFLTVELYTYNLTPDYAAKRALGYFKKILERIQFKSEEQ
jgi:sugar phosphate isomerase/epimerase